MATPIRPLRWAAAASFALSFACGGGTDKPVIESFTASPLAVTSGSRTTLSWLVRGASTVSVSATPGGPLVTDDLSVSGTVQSAPITENTTFRLVAKSPGGEASAEIRVSVGGGGPTILLFVADPDAIAPGGSSTLRWETNDAESVDIETADGTSIVADGAADGNRAVTPTEDTTYVLTARGSGTATAMVTVLVDDGRPRIARFEANPSTIMPGRAAQLVWEVSGADEVVIRDGEGTEVDRSTSATGNVEVSPPRTTVYTLVATNPVGERTRTVTLNVGSGNGARIVSFDTNRTSVPLGTNAVLSWTVENANRVEVFGGGRSLASSTNLMGTLTVTPTVATTYRLVAAHPDGNDSATVRITVGAGAPFISTLLATPNPVRRGGTSEVAWLAATADSVRLFREGAEVYSGLGETGTFDSIIGTATVTFELRATNALGESRRTLRVFGHGTPVVRSFSATPQTFMGSTTAELRWNVANVALLELYASGVPVPGFPGVSGSGGTVDDIGMISVNVTTSTRFRLVATSAAGSVDAFVSVFAVMAKSEPNNSAATATLLAGDGSGFTGEINPGNDQDWYAFMVPVGGNVFAETSDGMGGCLLDTTLTLTSTNAIDDLLFANDISPSNPCSRIDPQVDRRARNMGGGLYYIRVESIGPVTGPYALQVRVEGPRCGNGILERNETCDDGNVTPGDGCNATCISEPLGVVNGPGQTRTFVGSIRPEGELDFYQVQMSAPGYIRAETFVPAVGQCIGGDPDLALLDSARNVIGTDEIDGLELCALIDPEFDSFAFVPAGNYWIRVTTPDFATPISQYTLVIRTFSMGCGNGIVEAGEQCDDGNVVSADGCSATCTFEGIMENEAGGNDTPSGGGILTATNDTVFLGGLTPNDRDWYAVMVPAGYHLDAFLTVNSLTTCPTSPEGRLTLYATNGTTVLADDRESGPQGNCGRIYPYSTTAARAMAAGIYFLQVRESGGATIGQYYLHITLRAPGCGNGYREGNEACDDGNMAAGDGCSATCTFEPLVTYSSPGPLASFAGSLAPGQVNALRIQVTAESYLFTETLTDPASGTCTGGADTVLRLFDQNGFTQLGFDDFDGVNGCSSIDPNRDAFARMMPGTYWLTVEENGLNGVIPNYTLLVRGRPVNVCGNGVRESAETCDDANVTSGDGCSAACQIEPLLTYTGPSGRVTVSGSISAPGEVDWYRIEVSADMLLSAETFFDAVARTCPAGTDTLMRLYAANATTQLGFDNDDGVNLCSRFDPLTDPFTALTPGTYWLTVEENGRDAQIASYTLVLDSLQVNACGNGVREAGEFCDDGNPTNGDGCSSTCRFETTSVYTAPNLPQVFPGSILVLGEVDVVRIDVSQTMYLLAESFAPTAASGTCNAVDTFLRLYDDQANELGTDDDGGVNLCARIRRLDHPFARLTPGTYWLSLEEFGNDGTILQYEIRLSSIPPDVCGDGVVEPATGEQCDDGGVASGDGCSSTCTIEPQATYSLPGPPQIFSAAIPVSSFRAARLDVAVGAYVRAQTFVDATAGTCTVDTRMSIIDSGGNVLADDEDGGVNNCSLLTPIRNPGTRLGPGTYFLIFEESGRDLNIPAMQARIESYPLDVCGNTVAETAIAEQCDDGNTVSGDGCSASCAFGPYSGPGPATLIYGAITPAGDVDTIPINTSVLSYVIAETFEPVAGFCSVDTRLQLLASDGVTLLGEDDFGGIDSCSLIGPSQTFSRVAAGSYFLAVREDGNDAAIPTYALSLRVVAANVCGNGIVETGEICDDGNTSSGDGCSSSCQPEINLTPEIEPNNTLMQSQSSGLSGVGNRQISAQITPVGDLDYFSFIVPSGQTLNLTANTYSTPGDINSICSGGAGIDTLIRLLNAGGSLLAENDDINGSINRCSRVQMSLGAGTYHVAVQHYNNTLITNPYYLNITLAP